MNNEKFYFSMFTVELPVGILIAVGLVTALLDLGLLETTENTENYLETSHLSGDTYVSCVFMQWQCTPKPVLADAV